ncbi:MAG: hypothetical protein AAF655_04975 [Bacteroidota bacterium]
MSISSGNCQTKLSVYQTDICILQEALGGDGEEVIAIITPKDEEGNCLEAGLEGGFKFTLPPQAVLNAPIQKNEDGTYTFSLLWEIPPHHIPCITLWENYERSGFLIEVSMIEEGKPASYPGLLIGFLCYAMSMFLLWLVIQHVGHI